MAEHVNEPLPDQLTVGKLRVIIEDAPDATLVGLRLPAGLELPSGLVTFYNVAAEWRGPTLVISPRLGQGSADGVWAASESHMMPPGEAGSADTLVCPDGFLRGLWSENGRGETVYPYQKESRRPGEEGIVGFDVTPTSNRDDYRLMVLDDLLDFLASGSFIKAGRIRMRPLSGGPDGGFSMRKAGMSAALVAELLRRRDRVVGG